VLARAAGQPPRWFRPPAGVISPRVASAARRLGLELVLWTATARDGVLTTPKRALARLVRALRPGAILVLHDGSQRPDRAPIAAAVLEPLCDALDARGLRSVTLDELLLEPARNRES
jgi:peptidoglycan/xylan/chitin deacetylase (PgdA/CDA1 family)